MFSELKRQMSGRATRSSSGHAGGGAHARIRRAAGCALVVVLLAGACSSATATPSGGTGSAGSAGSPAASLWPSPGLSIAQQLASFQPSPRILTGGPFDIVKGAAVQSLPDESGLTSAGSAIDDFGFDLLRKLDATGNSCVSPTSIALALAMVRPGARGATASQMDAVLHGFGAPGQEAEIAALLKTLNSVTYYWDQDAHQATASPPPGKDPTVTLNVTDQVFSQTGMNLLADYLNSLSSAFDAGIGQLDFRADAEAARQTINNWVGQQTAGRIPQILQPDDVTNASRIALVNAIYLKAGWSNPFDPTATANRPFTTSGGTISVPTMSQEKLTGYASGDGYRAVELYMGFSGLSMTIVVPDDMTSFVAGLSASSWPRSSAPNSFTTWI